jgi:hypothetical protein
VLAAALPQLAQCLGQGRGKRWEMGISLKKWGDILIPILFVIQTWGEMGS